MKPVVVDTNILFSALLREHSSPVVEFVVELDDGAVHSLSSNPDQCLEDALEELLAIEEIAPEEIVWVECLGEVNPAAPTSG